MITDTINQNAPSKYGLYGSYTQNILKLGKNFKILNSCYLILWKRTHNEGKSRLNFLKAYLKIK